MATTAAIIAFYSDDCGYLLIDLSAVRDRFARTWIIAAILRFSFSASARSRRPLVSNLYVVNSGHAAARLQQAITRPWHVDTRAHYITTIRGLARATGVLAKPLHWLLASTALSVTTATFSTPVADVGRYVPNVPPILFRADVTVRGPFATTRNRPVIARAGVYTLLSGRHVTDSVVGPTNHVLNANAAVRYGWFEIGLDAYNVVGLAYPDDQQVYASNWSLLPGGPGVDRSPSVADHIVEAPPRIVLGTVSLYF